MAQLKTMAHELPAAPLPTLSSRADYVGYALSSLGENIAFNYSDPGTVMTGWMNSPGHRANILNGDYTEIGVGVARDAAGAPTTARSSDGRDDRPRSGASGATRRSAGGRSTPGGHAPEAVARANRRRWPMLGAGEQADVRLARRSRGPSMRSRAMIAMDLRREMTGAVREAKQDATRRRRTRDDARRRWYARWRSIRWARHFFDAAPVGA